MSELGTLAKIIFRKFNDVDQAIMYAKRMAQHYANSRDVKAFAYQDAAEELEAWGAKEDSDD